MWPMVRKSLFERLGISQYTVTLRSDFLLYACTMGLVLVTKLWEMQVTQNGVPNN